MARGIALSALRNSLKSEIGQTTQANVTQQDPQLNQVLIRVEEWLYNDHNWPFLRGYGDVTLTAGIRYYNYPTFLNFERIESVWWKDISAGQFYELALGIGAEEYNDTAEGTQQTVLYRWAPYIGGGTEQFEVWPAPDTTNDVVRFYGIKKFTPMTVDASLSTLDGTLIVLFAAAELLARQKSPDAEQKLVTATQLYNRIKTLNTSTKRRPFVLGLGDGSRYDSRGRRGIDYIP